MSVVALVGNGLSTAYNPQLSVHQLTAAILDRFRERDDDLRAIADDVGRDDHRGFEDLLGPFDAVSAMIGSLAGLRTGGDWARGFRALGESLQAARGIHRNGAGIALDVIAERSHGDGDFESIDAFCSAIADLDRPENLTVATLNYDSLVTAGFLQEWVRDDWTVGRTLRTTDMGDGRTESRLRPDFADDGELATWELRRVPDFLNGAARLLNLHGSLGWLRNGEDPDDVRRFRIRDLRDAGYWAKNCRSETVWEPVVVLTSRKTELVQEWPFGLCYAEFRAALYDADRWLIAGYGFGDDPVNAALRAGVQDRRRRHRESRVLVIGIGDPEALSRIAQETCNVPEGWISSSAAGLPDALTSPEWQQWAG